MKVVEVGIQTRLEATQKRQQSYGSLSDIKNCSQELERRAETNSQSTFDLHWLVDIIHVGSMSTRGI